MKNVNETKLEALNLVKNLNNSEVDELISNAQKVLNFVEYYVGDCPNKLQEKKEKFIEVVDRQLNQYNYKDPLRKEYARHAIVADYIDQRLKTGIQELCKQIDEEIGEEYTTVKPEYKTGEKLGNVYINGLVPDGKESVFSSGDYVSPSAEKDSEGLRVKYPSFACSEEPERKEECEKIGHKPKIILTHREKVDKELLRAMNEKVQEDIQRSKDNMGTSKKKSTKPLVDLFIKEQEKKASNPIVMGSSTIQPTADFKDMLKDVLERMHKISISEEYDVQ